MDNLLKHRLQQNKKPVGTFFSMGSSEAVEALGIAGMDYVILDKEHGPYGVETVQHYIRAAERRNITPLVRIKDATRPSVLKVLDIGAQGLIVPMIKTRQEVERVIEYAKYHPSGSRGVALTRSSSYGDVKSLKDYFKRANEGTLLIPQCETRECVQNIDSILDLKEVDGIFIGPYDLSQAFGKPGQTSDPEIQGIIDGMLRICKEYDKYSFIYAPDKETAAAYFKKGFDSIAIGMDILLYIDTFKDIANMPR